MYPRIVILVIYLANVSEFAQKSCKLRLGLLHAARDCGVCWGSKPSGVMSDTENHHNQLYETTLILFEGKVK